MLLAKSTIYKVLNDSSKHEGLGDFSPSVLSYIEIMGYYYVVVHFLVPGLWLSGMTLGVPYITG